MSSDMMRAAVYVGEGRIDVAEVPVPHPDEGELLVEVADCGICGSDLHLVFDGYAQPGAILGHEWSGTVVGGRGDLAGRKEGDRVVSNPAPGCGSCRACRRGRPSVCRSRPPMDFNSWRGAFARYVTIPASHTSIVPEGLSLRTAALAEPTSIVLHGIDLAGVEPADRVLVTGAGPIGLLTTAVLRARGVEQLVVSEPSSKRRERALALGASRVITPDELPEAPRTSAVAEPFDIVFECSGRGIAAEQGLEQLDYAGTLVFVGTGSEPARVNQNRMIIFELEAIGTLNYSANGFAPALELLASGDLPSDLLIEPQDVGLDGVMGAMEKMAAAEVAAKLLVNPSTP